MASFRVSATPVRDDSIGELRRGGAAAQLHSPLRTPKLASPGKPGTPMVAARPRATSPDFASAKGIRARNGGHTHRSAASARSRDDADDPGDGDYFSADMAMQNFEAKVKTMDEVKKINGRVDVSRLLP